MKNLRVDVQGWTTGATKNIITDVTKQINWKHYGAMVNTILNKEPTTKEKTRALNQLNKQISDDQKVTLLSKLRSGYKIYNDLVFCKPNYVKMWEAYIHHLAHWHGWNWNTTTLANINRNPRDEEGNYFLTLLYAANAGSNFTAGGDVIVVEAGKIKVNVQIKGIKDMRNKVGNPIGLYTARDKYLEPLLRVLNQNDSKTSLSNEAINKLYNELKNSAWIKDASKDSIEKLELEKLISNAYISKLIRGK